MSAVQLPATDLPLFNRNFWDGNFRSTRIGSGALGGKASGLVFIREILAHDSDLRRFPDFRVDVPVMAVIGTDFFDQFIAENSLSNLNFEELSDDRIGHAFQKADLPVELLGDLRALIQQVKTPLAVRSSSLLEDAAERPFAGVYGTKMIPNNQFDPDTRFRRLAGAIKFVYASVFFREARGYLRASGYSPGKEKMAVILQEVVGRRHGDRFYPDFSGVARSYNFYSTPPARPEDGLATLALGLGKTIVDGDIAWTFSPTFPKKGPPLGSVQELLHKTQTQFWAVNMGQAPVYDPVNEVEYLVRGNLSDAENDEVLEPLASTYDAARDRVVPGLSAHGPRVLNFAPLLAYDGWPVSQLLQHLLSCSEKATGAKVEMEFAATFQSARPVVQFGFLQVRPMALSDQVVDVSLEELSGPNVVVATEVALGNGIVDNLQDIVFVRPETFSPMVTPKIASELDTLNRKFEAKQRPYLLIGIGRLGSTHPSLGIPVDWSQISSARVLVESTLPEMDVEPSQGSHFFHNLASFHVSYFMVRHDRQPGIDWDWLNRQPIVEETEYVRHVRPSRPLSVRVDGRSSRGVVLKNEAR